MSRSYERVASAMVGTPLQAAAEAARSVRNTLAVRREPGLRKVLSEDRSTTRLMGEVLRPDSNCVDVGCHLGVMLDRMVRLAPGGHHHAFEPVPYKAEWLRRKFPSVEIHQMALSDHDEVGQFHVNTGSSALSALRTPRDADASDVIAVETSRLDAVLDPQTRVDFLKVDAIGAELLVLRGAEATIRRHRPILLFEASRATLATFDLDASMIHDLVVGELGYRLHSLHGWSVGEAPLDADHFEQAMAWPFEAFNFVAFPADR